MKITNYVSHRKHFLINEKYIWRVIGWVTLLHNKFSAARQPSVLMIKESVLLSIIINSALHRVLKSKATDEDCQKPNVARSAMSTSCNNVKTKPTERCSLVYAISDSGVFGSSTIVRALIATLPELFAITSLHPDNIQMVLSSAYCQKIPNAWSKWGKERKKKEIRIIYKKTPANF